MSQYTVVAAVINLESSGLALIGEARKDFVSVAEWDKKKKGLQTKLVGTHHLIVWVDILSVQERTPVQEVVVVES